MIYRIIRAYANLRARLFRQTTITTTTIIDPERAAELDRLYGDK